MTGWWLGKACLSWADLAKSEGTTLVTVPAGAHPHRFWRVRGKRFGLLDLISLLAQGTSVQNSARHNSLLSG